jgi:DNA-binding NarL/FixJ family response regulator
MDESNTTLIMADNQPITRLGVITLWNKVVPDGVVVSARNKAELISLLVKYPKSIVVMDYTLFNMPNIESLLIIGMRFPRVRWILFSDELNEAFLRRIIPENRYSVVMKDATIGVLIQAIQSVLTKKQFLCEQVRTILNHKKEFTTQPLTPTEQEILKGITRGKTSQQIAEERCSSIHTIATHRKNIFRKIGVNNVLEASKYAVQAGIVDITEYDI